METLTTTSSSDDKPLNDTTTDFVEIDNAQTNNKLNESAIIDDLTLKHNLDEDDLKSTTTTSNTNENNVNSSFTTSTLVITKSQIIEDDLNKSCVDLGDALNDSKNLEEEVRGSIEILSKEKKEDAVTSEDDDKTSDQQNKTLDEFVQPTSEDVKAASETTVNAMNTDDYSVGMNKSLIDSQTITNTDHDELITKNTSLDEENLEKDYEIPSMTSLNTNQMIKSEQFVNLDSAGLEQPVTTNKRVRNLADEVYEQPLGSDSLQKKIVQYGDEDTRPRNGQMCTISYKAYIKDTDEIVEQDDNLSFILGDGDVIPAIDLIVCLMDKNEICEVIAEARHAYGKLGKKLPSKSTTTNTLFIEIPPDATLFLRINLKEYTNVTDMNQMQPVERLSLAEAKKLRGNFYFNRQEFYLADLSYKKGLSYFNEENLTGDEEVADIEKFLDLRKALLMNLSLSTFKQGEYRSALLTLDELLAVQKNHVKALFVKGKCLVNLGETKEAVEYLTKCYELDKNNQDVKNELTKAQAKYKTQYENEKKMYQKMMSGVSPDSKNETKKVKSSKLSKSSINTNCNKNDSSYKSYVLAGLAVAALSIGVTMLAKYKNMF